MQPGRARTSGLGVPLLPLARWVGWVAPVRTTHGVLVHSCPSAALRVCSVLGRLAPVHRCARAVCCVASAVSWATWLLFTGVLARCVVLRVRCPGPLGSRSPVRPLGVLCGVCGVPGHLAPVHWCARSVCCFACAVSWATWLLFTGVPAWCVVLRVRCPGPLGCCSPVCPLGVLLCMCGVLGHLAPVHRCARSVCCVMCPSALPAVSSSVFPLLLSFRRACFALFFLGGGGLGCGVFGAVRGCGCVPVPVLVWAWVSWGTGVGWLSRSGFPVCAPASRLPVSRAPVRGVLTAVVAWRLRGWSRLLGSAWVAWPGAGVRVGVFMAWADGVVGSVGMAGLCGCRACVRRRRGVLGWGTVGDAMGGGDAGDAYGGGAVGVETGWCC